jgi:hypothetical protein
VLAPLANLHAVASALMAETFADDIGAMCTADATEALFPQRGWSMRHGRRKRLVAIARTEESYFRESTSVSLCRGRSVFKRSANRGQRLHGSSWSGFGEVGRYAHSQLACKEECKGMNVGQSHKQSASAILAELQGWTFEDLEFDEWWQHSCSDEDNDGDAERAATTEQVACDECSTCASTVASLDDFGVTQPRKIEETMVTMSDAMQENSINQGRPLSPWVLALRRAEQSAKLYFRQCLERCTEEKQRPRRVRRVEQEESFAGEREHRNLLKSLESSYNATTSYTRPGQGPFEELRWKFFKEHSPTFCQGLMQCLGGTVHICPTPLAAKVGEQFRLACHGGRTGTLVPAFHGTHENSLSGIYSSGLVVPGQGNVVKVLNGSVHGVGIYTASMTNPAISRGYARGQNPPILVCGVLDPMKEEEVVRHVGGAMVVFEEDRVAPLFVATQVSSATLSVAPGSRPEPMLPRPRRIASPHPPTPLRRGPAKKERRAQLGPPAKVYLVGVSGFLSRRAARRRFGPLNRRSTAAAQLER